MTSPVSNSCHNCQLPILDEEDQVVLTDTKNSEEKYYTHQHCLKCSICGEQQNELKSLMRRDNALYCHKDYYNLFDKRNCHICQNTIEAGTMAYPLGNETFVHMTCFQCTVCDTSLVTGHSKFGFDGVRPFCLAHVPTIADQQQSPEVHGSSDNEVTTSFSAMVSIKSETSSSDASTTSSTTESTEDSIEDDADDLKSKKRTPRTKFTEKQTAMMMDIFSQTPRPTRLMREHLAKTTGLPVRCIQIWFQNKRSKEKRQNSKRFMPHTPVASMYGPPMYPTMFHHAPIYPAGVVPQHQPGHGVPQTTLPSPHVSPNGHTLYPTPPPPECMNNQPSGMGGPEVSPPQFHEVSPPQFHEKMEDGFFIPPHSEQQQQQPPSFETALQNHQTYPSPTWSNSESLDFNMEL